MSVIYIYSFSEILYLGFVDSFLKFCTLAMWCEKKVTYDMLTYWTSILYPFGDVVQK